MGKLLIEVGQTVRSVHPAAGPLYFRTRHEAHLLGALALASPAELRRDALAYLLWPDSARGNAQQNLRQRIASLRMLVGEVLQADRKAVWLQPGTFHLGPRSAGDSFEACSRLVQECAATTPMGYRPASWIRRTEHGLLSGDRTPYFNPTQAQELLNVLDSDIHEPDEQLALAFLLTDCSLPSGALERLLGFFANIDESRVRRSVHQAFCTRLAQVAHRQGQWHTSLMLEREAERLADSRNVARWASFRHLRKQIDLRVNRELLKRLMEMRGDPNTPSELHPWIDMNLVFACAVRREVGEAEAARQRARRNPMTQNNQELLSWLHLNEAMLTCLVGKPRIALDYLREAWRAVPSTASPLGCFWHWYGAVHTMSALGRGADAANLYTLAEQARERHAAHLTPINRVLLDHSLSVAMTQQTPHTWLSAVHQARQLPLSESPALYEETIAI